MIELPDYFNIQTSPTMITINANKGGIDQFLKLYGNLEEPPEIIDLKNLKHANYIWGAKELEDNPNATPDDISSYRAWSSGYRNHSPDHFYNVLDFLKVRLIKTDSNKTIFYVIGKLQEGELPILNPELVVNKKGWNSFIQLIHILHDKKNWFYITYVNERHKGLPFQLTPPEAQDADQFIIKAFEFIQPELDETPCIRIRDCCIAGNCLGLLLLSKWMRDFAPSQHKKREILNQWTQIPGLPLKPNHEERSVCFKLRKFKEEIPEPLVSIELFSDDNVFYFYGNDEGFKRLGEIFETHAFNQVFRMYSHCFEYEKNSRWNYYIEKIKRSGVGWPNWDVFGGFMFSTSLNPFAYMELNSWYCPSVLGQEVSGIHDYIVDKDEFYVDFELSGEMFNERILKHD